MLRLLSWNIALKSSFGFSGRPSSSAYFLLIFALLPSAISTKASSRLLTGIPVLSLSFSGGMLTKMKWMQ